MPRIFSIIALCAWICLLWPYPNVAFLAACIACVSYSWYQRLCLRFSPLKGLVLYTIVIILCTTLPIGILVLLVVPQALNGLRMLERFSNPVLLQSPELQEWLVKVDEWLKDIPGLEGGIHQVIGYIAQLAGDAARIVVNSGLGIAGGAFNFVVDIFLFILVTVMYVMYAEVIFDFSMRITTLSKVVLKRFIVAFRNAIFGILMGVVFVALIQGMLCGLGFMIADVPQPAFWGLVATLVAPIPFIGTTLVWIPISLWLWLTGSSIAAIGLAVWASLVVTGVDNVMRPLFLQQGINTSFIALIVSIICGLAAFGPSGIFAGPILVTLALQANHESHIGTNNS